MDYARFQQNVLYHYKTPPRKGRLAQPTFTHHESNPVCGDDVTVDVEIQNGVVQDAAFDGHGCSISQAAASMLTDEIVGKTVAHVKRLTPDDVVKLVGVPLSPVRLRCALVALRALKVGLYTHEGDDVAAAKAAREIG